MATRRESSIQASILKMLNKVEGCRAENNHGSAMQGAGRPDIYGCYRGQFFAIEVKRPGKEATDLQLLRLMQWERAGGIAFVATSVEEVRQMLGIKIERRTIDDTKTGPSQ